VDEDAEIDAVSVDTADLLALTDETELLEADAEEL
jgi:hypothetical protein